VLDTLPLALGIALSPFPVIPAILLLFTERPRAAGLAFLTGWLLGVGSTATAFVLLSEVVGDVEDSPSWASWARIVLGAALVVYGVVQWRGRGRATEPPAWMQSVSSATPGRALRLALLLSVPNPKILLIAAGAGLTIGADETLSGAAEVAAVLLFTVVASLTVAAPVVSYVVVGDRVLRPLGVARDWLQRNNAAVMSVVLFVLGLLLLQKGITGL